MLKLNTSRASKLQLNIPFELMSKQTQTSFSLQNFANADRRALKQAFHFTTVLVIAWTFQVGKWKLSRNSW